MTRRMAAVTMVLAAVFVLPGCKKETSASVDRAALTVFAPLPAAMETPANPLTEAKTDLGRMLYYDTRLSANNNQSCNSCHDLATYGVDNRRVSLGTNNQPGGRNAPTVYNAAAHIAQFWDGRAPTVEEQAKGPVLNPVEMGMPNADAVVRKLRAVREYREAFAKAFPGQRDAVTYENVGLAIGAFERRLVTPGRWDRFLAGDTAALTREERQGLNVFLTSGCQGCHNGAEMGGAMFQKLGMVNAWPDRSDVGREAVTHNAADSLVFKVPSLRNVEHTGPYFHNGQVVTLNEAVGLMAHHQLGKTLTPEQTTQIVAFLKSLSGDQPAAYAAPRSVQQ